ncbi:helix-turn-helix transcriptional regulator [Kitasatospora sp. NPDC048545]|uniref:helix-turn-helix domain-containing protein n=1 Tax=Kitasatospora sp. NPDC048545 TaxID=3157208 RepID=UPI0033E7DAC3
MTHRLNIANLREVAIKLGDKSDYSIAKRSGVSRATLSRLASGQAEPSIGTLMKLAASYRVMVEYLVCEPEQALPLAA